MTELDPVVHAPLRLRLLSMLSVVDDAEFLTLRDHLGIADSVLSKHTSVLVEAGYATTRKGSVGGRRTTWIALTRKGRRALQRHLQALQEMVEDAQRTAQTPTTGPAPSRADPVEQRRGSHA